MVDRKKTSTNVPTEHVNVYMMNVLSGRMKLFLTTDQTTAIMKSNPRCNLLYRNKTCIKTNWCCFVSCLTRKKRICIN